jgi:hypothetical protein
MGAKYVTIRINEEITDIKLTQSFSRNGIIELP